MSTTMLECPPTIVLRLSVDGGLAVPEVQVAAGASGMGSADDPIRVILVDDDGDLRAAVRRLLEDQGFAVVGEAADGGEAVAVARDTPFDLVVMDLKMPVLDGIEATRRIRATDPGARVVLLSAYDDPGFKRQAAEAGAVAYILKGTRADDVLDILYAAVARPTAPETE